MNEVLTARQLLLTIQNITFLSYSFDSSESPLASLSLASVSKGRVVIQPGSTSLPHEHAQPNLSREMQDLKDQLSESRRQFASVLGSLSGLFYRCELKAPWRMSFVSEGVQALTGYTKDDLELQYGWSAIIGIEDRQRVEREVADAISQDRNFDVVYRIVCKSGEARWVSEHGRAVCDEAGQPLFLEGVIADISGRKEAEELQRTMVKRWRHALDAIPQMVWTMSGDGSDEFYNARWFEFTGCDVGKTEELGRAELIHVDDRAGAIALWDEKFASGEPYEAQYRLKHVSGDYRWIISRGECEKDPNGVPIRWYGTCTDIHEKVVGRLALEASESVNRSMVEASPDWISLLDLDGRIRFLNPAAIKALNLNSAGPLLGNRWGDVFPPSFQADADNAVAQAASGRKAHFTASQLTPQGERWWDIVVAPVTGGVMAVSGLISVARDITHQRTAEEQVRWTADHDALTRLPNRALFQRTLDHALFDPGLGGTPLTVLMMDLDDFKRTNDALGHDAGDALLTEFATRLKNSVRPDDTVARFGGDEFAVLLWGVSDDNEIKAAVRSIVDCLRPPFEFDGRLLDVRTSIGASTSPSHGTSSTELLKHADIALYAAKGSGRGVLRIFQPEMRANALARVSMLELARDAIQDNRIVAYYQPKIDLRSGRIDGLEALLRWKHPTKGLQTADTIDAAFDDGVLAAEISERMIGSVVADMQRWTDAGIDFGHVAVNAGAAEFKDATFAERLLEGLQRAKLPTSCLQLEVTETVFLGRGAEYVEDALKALSKTGIQIALDDFGTGYASLSHLNKFPVDIIKIDRSFIAKLETSDHDAAIVRAVINLGRSLGIKIVAEGIETQNQVNFLKRHRCQSGQGYFFGKASHPTMIPSLIANWGARRATAA